MTIMQQSIQALSSGLAPDRLVEFWAKAKQMADVSSRPTVEMFEGLTRAINKLEVESLETIGITLKAGKVYEDWGKKIGKTRKEMTYMDEQMAFSAALEEKYQENFASVGNVTTEVRERFQQVTTSLKNMYNNFTKYISETPGLVTALEKINRGLKDAKFWIEDHQDDIVDATETTIDAIGKVTETTIEAIGKLSEWVTKVDDIWAESEMLTTGVKIVVEDVWDPMPKISDVWDEMPKISTGPAWSTRLMTTLSRRLLDKAFIGVRMWGAIKRLGEGLYGEAPPDIGGVYPDPLLRAISTGPQEAQAPPGPREAQAPPGKDFWSFDYEPPETETDTEQMKFDNVIELDQKMLEHKEGYYDTLTEMAGRHYETVSEVAEQAQSKMANEMLVLKDAYIRSLSVMDKYSVMFYNAEGKRGRVVNAMLIDMVGEMVSSYLMGKAKQAATDAAYAAAQAILHGAAGDWSGAAQYGIAAAKFSAISGTAFAGAAWAKGYAQEKAAGLEPAPEMETTDFSQAESDTESARERQTTEATGVVKQRPINITISSATNINAGVAVFSGDPDAIADYYDQYIRPQIQEDINTGIMAIPA
jgi:hypothetical protein